MTTENNLSETIIIRDMDDMKSLLKPILVKKNFPTQLLIGWQHAASQSEAMLENLHGRNIIHTGNQEHREYFKSSCHDTAWTLHNRINFLISIHYKHPTTFLRGWNTGYYFKLKFEWLDKMNLVYVVSFVSLTQFFCIFFSVGLLNVLCYIMTELCFVTIGKKACHCQITWV